ncbi:B-cell receptor CD22 isoform X5 [Odocoileus virginianus]|uniref:B-cell receptor CD22 n=1 Tax=Odocoileus virginianus TaxID=9874 RepID=A0ABM4GWZ5_ODOVR
MAYTEKAHELLEFPILLCNQSLSSWDQGKGVGVGAQEELSGRCQRPGGSKTNSSWPRLLPRHSTMHLLGPSLLLLGYLVFSDSTYNAWTFKHPKTLYAWDGACVWIPCTYSSLKGSGHILDNLTVYHNFTYDKMAKNYIGTILYSKNLTTEESTSSQERVRFLGNRRNNCTLLINPVRVDDSGLLGLRVMSRTDKWMASLNLSISERAPQPHIELPQEIREDQEVTATCSLNFACYDYQIHLQWSLEGSVTTSTILSPETVATQSRLSFQPSWTHNGKNLTCQLWDPMKKQLLSEKTVLLEVKYPPKGVTTVIQNPTPIREGDSVTLSCTFNSSNPRVTRYNWNSPGSQDQTSQEKLTIQKVTWDAAPVKCEACNQWCSWSPSVNLNVHYAPKDVSIQISPHTEVRSGEQVLLRCEFSSSHPEDVHYFWKKDGNLLEKRKTLTFDSISPEDSGTYHCLVNNSIGQTSSEACELRVLYAPRRLRVSISPKDGVVEGKMAVLTCESDANPAPSHYNWFDGNNQDLHHYGQTLRLEPVKLQHSGSYWCRGANRLGQSQSPPTTLTVYYSAATISRRAALGVGFCLAIFLLAIWGVKLQRSWKRIQRQQGLQESSSGQSFFVRNIKARRTPQAERPHSLGCYNPVMEDAVSYATLSFPLGETDTQRLRDAESSEMREIPPSRDDSVTYAVVQNRQVADYENVTPEVLDDEGIHYSELVHFGNGKRALAQEGVEYVTLKH